MLEVAFYVVMTVGLISVAGAAWTLLRG